MDEREKTELLKSIPKHQQESRVRGYPSLGSGAIYQFREEDLVIKPLTHVPQYFQRFFAVDPGWNFTASVFFARNPDTTEIFITDEFGGSQMPPQEMAQHIKRRADTGNGIMWGCIDPAARGRSQIDGKRLLTEYENLGLKLQPAKNQVEAGLFSVQCLMSEQRLKIYEGCVGLLSELRMYQRLEDGRVKKINDHFCDAMRYGIMTTSVHLRPRPDGFKPKVITGY